MLSIRADIGYTLFNVDQLNVLISNVCVGFSFKGHRPLHN